MAQEAHIGKAACKQPQHLRASDGLVVSDVPQGSVSGLTRVQLFSNRASVAATQIPEEATQ